MEVTIPFTVTGTIASRPCPGVEELRYAKRAHLAASQGHAAEPHDDPRFLERALGDAYPDPFELAAEAADAVRGWMRDLAAAGCEYIQIDAPGARGGVADERVRAEYDNVGSRRPRCSVWAPSSSAGSATSTSRVAVSLCTCAKGTARNRGSRRAATRPRESVFARATGFDAFLLEYDDERSGSFEPSPPSRTTRMPCWASSRPSGRRSRIPTISVRGSRRRRGSIRGTGSRSPPVRVRVRERDRCGAADHRRDQETKLRLVADVAARVWGGA